MATESVVTHERLRRLFDRLVDSPQAEHAAIMREEHAQPDEVRELKGWLASDQNGSPLDAPLTQWLNNLGDADYADALIGRHAGPYLLTDVLGRGGSSIVFRATRTLGDLEQVVALKLLQSGLYSQESRRRFRREQSILMQLSHPNIVPLIDAGLTDAGVPYIAMEEVRGRDLLAYANAENLDDASRLRLVVDVCRAIDAAHRALIVHRDIKPSNVLVSDDGHVKVLDFGIAKLISDDTARTATQHIALTPAYAAPEQFRSGLVMTSADVYALGVLAGELLIGARLAPDAVLTPSDAESTIVASRWRSLDRDLLNILRMATALEPERRYVSAGYLADDIERFLAGQPVAAHPPSTSYRLRKFIARRRITVALTAVFTICLLASLAFSLSQAARARKAAVAAQMEAARANTMRDFIFDAFSEAEPLRPHSTPTTISEMVDQTIEKLRSDRAMDPRARLELRVRLAEVVGAQGDLERAASLLMEIHSDATTALGDNDPLTMEVDRAIERNLYFRGKYKEARAAIDRLLKTLPDPATENGVLLLRDSASIAIKLHDMDRALDDAESAVRFAERTATDDLIQTTLKTLGSALLVRGELTRAAAVYERELDLSREQFGADSDQVAAALSGLSRTYRRLGDITKAEQSARNALAIDTKIYSGDHWVTAAHLNSLGWVLLEKRDLDGAWSAFAESLRIDEKTLGPDHADVAIALHDLAAVALSKEDFATAEPLLVRALALSMSALGEHHWRTAAIRADLGYAESMAKSGNADGIDDMNRGIADLRAFAETDPHTFGRALEKRIRLFITQGDFARAQHDLAELEKVASRSQEQKSYWTGRTDCLSSELSLRAGELSAALAAAEKCGALLRTVERPDTVLAAEQPMLIALASAGERDPLVAAADRERFDHLPYRPRRFQEWTTRLDR